MSGGTPIARVQLRRVRADVDTGDTSDVRDSRTRVEAYVGGLPRLLLLELTEGRAWALRAAREALGDDQAVYRARVLARRLSRP